MSPDTPTGEIRPKSVLSFRSADELDRRTLQLAADLGELLGLVQDLAGDHRGLRALRHIESHLKAAAGRLERVKPYARQLWNEAVTADQGGRCHG